MQSIFDKFYPSDPTPKITSEKNIELKNLEEDLLDLNELTKDMNDLLTDQGERLVLIDDLTEKAEESTEIGADQLKSAESYTSMISTKLATSSIIGGVIVGGGVGAVFGLTYGLVAGSVGGGATAFVTNYFQS